MGAADVSSAAGSELGGAVEAVNETGAGIVVVLASVAAGLPGLAIALVVGALLGFYLIRDGSQVGEVLRRQFPDRRGEELANVGGRSMEILSGYMVATGALSAFSAVTQWLIMVVLGLPLALPLAVLSFFGGFIPYVGSFITTGIAFLVTVAVGDPIDILVMGIFTVVFNIVAGSFIGPIVYGRAVSLHPAVILVATPAGGAIAGIVGMFLAVPLIGIVSAAWRPMLRVIGSMSDPTGPRWSPNRPCPSHRRRRAHRLARPAPRPI